MTPVEKDNTTETENISYKWYEGDKYRIEIAKHDHKYKYATHHRIISSLNPKLYDSFIKQVKHAEKNSTDNLQDIQKKYFDNPSGILTAIFDLEEKSLTHAIIRMNDTNMIPQYTRHLYSKFEGDTFNDFIKDYNTAKTYGDQQKILKNYFGVPSENITIQLPPMSKTLKLPDPENTTYDWDTSGSGIVISIYDNVHKYPLYNRIISNKNPELYDSFIKQIKHAEKYNKDDLWDIQNSYFKNPSGTLTGTFDVEKDNKRAIITMYDNNAIPQYTRTINAQYEDETFNTFIKEYNAAKTYKKTQQVLKDYFGTSLGNISIQLSEMNKTSSLKNVDLFIKQFNDKFFSDIETDKSVLLQPRSGVDYSINNDTKKPFQGLTQMILQQTRKDNNWQSPCFSKLTDDLAKQIKPHTKTSIINEYDHENKTHKQIQFINHDSLKNPPRDISPKPFTALETALRPDSFKEDIYRYMNSIYTGKSYSPSQFTLQNKQQILRDIKAGKIIPLSYIEKAQEFFNMLNALGNTKKEQHTKKQTTQKSKGR